VGSGVAIFAGMVLTEQLIFKLDYRRSINQAEHLTIVKAPEVIETELVNHNEQRSAAIYNDSKITLDSIRSVKNHNLRVQEIRKRAVTVNKMNWKI